ncbi:MAG TPA: hypothetical protein VN901_26255 [Candidatus Acidoferrales bacterium]|nr:hypothetical protein [Candidatus Acidoferrales bacterium]
MPTSYDPSYRPSLPLAVIPSEHSPISPSAPAPFSAVKLPIQFASVGLFGKMIRNRVATRSLKSLGQLLYVQLRFLLLRTKLLKRIF